MAIFHGGFLPLAPLVVLILQATAASIDYSCLHSSGWILNGGGYNSIFASDTDVTASKFGSNDKWSITVTDIPSYGHIFTTEEIDQLNSRPKASSDFTTGSTTAVSGQYYEFGSDIGYAKKGCTLGYWPPGPECPVSFNTSHTFSLLPAKEVGTACGTQPKGGPIAYFLNGVSLFGWSDATSYNKQGIWNNLAMSFETYDMDVCVGHSAQSQYHHHSYSPCMAAAVGDKGEEHSPLYGFATDGFPIYGPYQSKGLLAASCWQARDYSKSSVTGCSDSARSCLLVDQLDYTKGTKAASSPGPSPASGSTVATQSGNTISSQSGIYYEDFFYNSSCTNQASPDMYQNLDQFNGHNHGDDELGYHYHLTIEETGIPVFPYSVGPKYYGCMSSSQSCSVCGSSDATSSYACK